MKPPPHTKYTKVKLPRRAKINIVYVSIYVRPRRVMTVGGNERDHWLGGRLRNRVFRRSEGRREGTSASLRRRDGREGGQPGLRGAYEGVYCIRNGKVDN